MKAASQSISPGRHSKKLSNANIDKNEPTLILSPHNIKFATRNPTEAVSNKAEITKYHMKSFSG